MDAPRCIWSGGRLLAALGVFVTTTAATSGAAPLFESPFLGFTAATGSPPAFIAHADVDGDGREDLVTAHQTSDLVFVWTGQGDGTFRTIESFSASSARCVATGDLNADGHLDLAIARLTEVQIALGNGDGTFGPNLVISYGTSVSTCGLADMDADGKLDLVTSSPSANVISIRHGNGDGTFSAFKSDFPTGARPWFFMLGDLDGNGSLDAVTVNTNASTVSVLLGTGAGGFFPKTDYPTGAGAVYGAIADLDGDLVPDIAVACGGANRVDVLLGGGSGAFAPATSVSTGVSNGTSFAPASRQTTMTRRFFPSARVAKRYPLDLWSSDCHVPSGLASASSSDSPDRTTCETPPVASGSRRNRWISPAARSMSSPR